MENFLTITAVLGIVTLGTYRLVELFVRRKERLMIIEKMQENANPHAFSNQLNLPFIGKPRGSSWTLRASLLMIGLGLGFITGLVIQLCFNFQLSKMEYSIAHNTISIIYLASVAVFGGIGLLVAYVIERKHEKNKLNERL